jgi:hypothetical protein
VKAFKLDGSRWYCDEPESTEAIFPEGQPVRLSWALLPVVGELLMRTGPEAECSEPRAAGQRVQLLSRTYPWPMPEGADCGYWDQLRTWQRFREEVHCEGCGEWQRISVDREPMTSGVLPSAVTFPLDCQHCGGRTWIGFGWLSWQVLSVRFEAKP